jgi:deazaflavin-dependent oxidoreductase (nitroreductase family)
LGDAGLTLVAATMDGSFQEEDQMAVELTPRGSFGRKMPRMPRFLMSVFMSLATLAYRVLGDRMRVMGQPLILLMTLGARTGRSRQTLVCRFPDTTNSWLVVGSYAGSAQHPAWYFNMAKNPDSVYVEIGGRRMRVHPTSLVGTERAQAWERIIRMAPGYDAYRQKTDRQIPIVRLSAIVEP